MITQRYSPLKSEPAPVQPAAPAPTVKKVNLAGFAKKKEASKTSDYPVFPDPHGKAAEAAAAILRMTEEFETLEGALKANKKFLIDLTAPFHFQNCSGKAEPAKAVVIDAGERDEEGKLKLWQDMTPDEREKASTPKAVTRVRVDFKNSYPVLEDESPLVPVLGDNVGHCFAQKFSLEIDGDKLPADKVEEMLEKLQRLFADYNASDALAVKSGMAPVAEFHVKRHTLLTPEQNLELQKVCPIRAAVATKNVK